MASAIEVDVQPHWLNSVSCPGVNVCVAVADGGVILISQDNGAS